MRGILIFLIALQPSYSPLNQDLLIIEASRSHSGTPQSVGHLWTSDQPHADTSTWQHTDIHAPDGIGMHDPRKEVRHRLRP